MSPQLPSPAPPVNAETEAFWDATTHGTLLLKSCRSCRVIHWYPRSMCPACGSFDTEWIEASGRGVVYSFTIVRRGAPPTYAQAMPYVVAHVELTEGPRILTNIVDCAPDSVGIGDRVEVLFHDTGASSALPRFRPAATAPARGAAPDTAAAP
jgi:uncharacterized OB-fold protein